MNKTIVIILVILVIIGGIFLFANRSSAPVVSQPATTTDNTANPQVNGVPVQPGAQMETGVVAAKVTVNYTDSGFSPKTVTIKKGDTVTFVNKSSIGLWVASNPHPFHTDYPGFDEKTSIANGGSWSFTFDRAGSWGYHNHRNPTDLATIVVQ
jgi:plastocyanin